MLLTIPDVLTSEQVVQARKILDEAEWIDGKVTAGPQASKVKDNMQLPENHPASRQLGEMVLMGLSKNPLFISVTSALAKVIVNKIANKNKLKIILYFILSLLHYHFFCPLCYQFLNHLLFYQLLHFLLLHRSCQHL